MMTREELIKIKEEKGLTIEQIAKGSGVPMGTLGKILTGQTQKPRTATMQAIEKALKGDALACLGKARYYEILREDMAGSFLVKEAEPGWGKESNDSLAHSYDPLVSAGSGIVWKKQGEYTAEDYHALPDDVRVELIDGTFYYMETPVLVHQDLAMEICVRLREHIRTHKGACKAIMSPMDVHPDGDDKTVLQPDVLVVCDRSKLRRWVYGSPDLVIEILSPSTKKKDQGLKLHKYAAMGVRELWYVDPERKTVTVHDLEHDGDVFLYGFDTKIPVRIWNGECVIDMAEIWQELKDLYE